MMKKTVWVFSLTPDMGGLYQQRLIPPHQLGEFPSDTKSTEVTQMAQGKVYIPEGGPHFRC